MAYESFKETQERHRKEYEKTHSSGASKTDRDVSSSFGGSSSSSNKKPSSSSGSSHKKPSSSSGSSNRGSSSSSSRNDYNKVTGTSGYAEHYRQAKANGASDSEAHKYATWKNGGSGLSSKDYDNIASANPNYNSSNRPSNNKNGYVKNDYDTGYYESDYLEQLKALEEQQLANQQQQDLIDELRKQLENQKSPEEIYDKIMSMMPKTKEQPTLSYAEATGMAKDRLNPLYNQQSQAMLQALDKNALARGFYGQKPTDRMKHYKASELEQQRNSAIANMAQGLVGQSEDTAMKKAGMELQEQQTQLNALVQALNQSGAMSQNNISNMFNMLGFMDNQNRYNDSKEFRDKQYQDEWGKYQDSLNFRDKQYNDNQKQQDFMNKLNIGKLTGYYDGNPTQAYQKMLNDFGLNKQKIALEQQKFKDSSARGWSNIQNSRDSLSYRMAHDNKIDTQNYNKYMADVQKKANDMTVAYLKSTGAVNMLTGEIDVSPEVFMNKYNQYLTMLTGQNGEILK